MPKAISNIPLAMLGKLLCFHLVSGGIVLGFVHVVSKPITRNPCIELLLDSDVNHSEIVGWSEYSGWAR